MVSLECETFLHWFEKCFSTYFINIQLSVLELLEKILKKNYYYLSN